MNFGTGRNIYEKEEEVFLDSHLLPAAVKCWFTAQGKGMPLSMKIQDEEGNIRSIGPIFTDTFRNCAMEESLCGNINAGFARKG